MSGDAGSGQLYYLGSRGAVCLCGLTCLSRLGGPRSDSAAVDLFILQAEQTNTTSSGWRERWGVGAHAELWVGEGRVLLDDLPDRDVTLDADRLPGQPVNGHSLSARTRYPDEPKQQGCWTNAGAEGAVGQS